MMMDTCDTIFDTLRAQLAQSFFVHASGNGCLIETPFTYPDRRLLTVHVSQLTTGELELSDDGYAHTYARISGVSKDVLSRAASDLERQYQVDAGHGEVVATIAPSGMLAGLIALIEASQGIADTVARKRLGESTNKLDRQIARALVVHNRIYDRKGRVPIGQREIDVDYNVLPTEQYQQLSLFSVSHKVSLRTAESIAYRINEIQRGLPAPGFSNRVLVISDERETHGLELTWSRVGDTIRDTGAPLITISQTAAIARWLAA